MFTGIITDIGIVEEVKRSSDSIRLTLKTSYDIDKIDMGASISCNGCCLTVVKKNKPFVEFDLSPETLDIANFTNIKKGDQINLEQAMKIGAELGGHIVTGHVDTIAEVVDKKIIDGNWQLKFKLPLSYKKYIAAKGSVTLNGVSLTVNKVENDIFEVNIIPHTLEKTNLHLLEIGSRVNLEIDLLARYIERLLQK